MLLCIVMITTFTRVYYFILAILFPSNSDILISTTSRYNIRHTSIHKLKLGSTKVAHIVSLTDYSNNKVRRLVHFLKYTGDKKVALFLAQLLGDYLMQEISDILSIYPSRPVYILPVPLSRLRRKERGFSQLELLLNCVKSQYEGLSEYINYSLIEKIKDTPPQTTLNKKDRLQNLKGAFKAHNNSLKDAHIILIDDVFTTGSTIAEVSKEIFRVGADKVDVVTLAHTN